MEYRHTQTALAPFFMFAAAVIVYFMIIGSQAPPAEVNLFVGALFAVIGVTMLLFSRLTTTIAGGLVTVAFGAGWPVRTMPTADISAAKQVRNTWWYGWGMRKIPNGWMYNVWGLDAVELDLPDNKKFRIGTDEPIDLVTAIDLNTTKRMDGYDS
ncbi:MAG: hypothetical protein ACR2N7_07335 [Acidimicrobiia bacterium]